MASGLLADAPVGVFDSGLGGLTVVREMLTRLPGERIIYVADQAHVPYGGRDLEEVRGFATGISAALMEWGCKAVLMACNISSAVALADVQAANPDRPALGVILPGAEAALAATEKGVIGVLATEGTVRSGAYTRALRAARPDVQVIEVACPQFVPLVEDGQERSPDARAAACEYLAPLLEAEADTVILGCTHYPFLLPILEAIAPEARFIDPAHQAVTALKSCLSPGLLRVSENFAAPVLATTGSARAFASQIRRFLPDQSERAEIRAAIWNEGVFYLPKSTGQG